MLFFLITFCFSSVLFYKSLALNPLPFWAYEMRLVSLFLWKDTSFFHTIIKSIRIFFTLSFFTSRMSPKTKKSFTFTVESLEVASPEISILDLPDLVLESILEKLPPDGLCRMASVCKSFRDRCVSDVLWEKHMNSKWGKIIGPAAYREWQWQNIASRKGSFFSNEASQNKEGLMGYLIHLWPLAVITSSFSSIIKKKKYLPCIDDSIMSWYLALESGNFWFPAQVYNRENGHVGFLLSCYDAELRYDQLTDTFEARYPPHGRRESATENGVTWDRLRAPPLDTSPHELLLSDCLKELRPGDRIEIQWRRNKEFPYGWWYGVVGHLETCDGNASYCRCRHSDSLVLEFNQYALGSRWRRTTISRKDHREEGNEGVGFYGGIRRLCGNEEISKWEKLWPAEVLE